MTKDEYLQWRSSSVTEKFMLEVIDRLDEDQSSLALNAGLNSLDDRKRVGRIEGLKFLMDWVPEVEEENE